MCVYAYICNITYFCFSVSVAKLSCWNDGILMGGLPYIFMENVDENKLTPTQRDNLRKNKLQQQLKKLLICSLLLSKKELNLNYLSDSILLEISTW